MDTSKLSPLFVQYFDLAAAHPDCLLLMRVGDFFEAYGPHAETLSRDLEIVLTSKECGDGRTAMAGVPFFALDTYLRLLIQKGHRVAIAEQMEDAKQAKKLVKREVIRVVTSGTILDPAMLEEQSHNFLLSLACKGGEVSLAAADVSTGYFVATELARDAERLFEEAARFRPAEVLVLGGDEMLQSVASRLGVATQRVAEEPQAERLLLRQFHLTSLHSCDLIDRPAAVLAAAGLVSYLKSTQGSQALSLDPPRGYRLNAHMVLDQTSRRNLELTETLLGRERKGSLLWAIDATCTSMGARVLKDWMLRPLLELAEIEERLEAVEYLVHDYARRSELREALGKVLDVERLLSRVVYQSANARDLLGLAQSLQRLPHIHTVFSGTPLEDRTQPLAAGELAELEALLSRAVAEEPPLSLREGGLIRDGYCAELDELRSLRSNAREWIASLEAREREESGIKSLKVGFNQVFGYYLEVTRTHLKSVPEHYIRKQTLANAERYFTPELKEFESKVLGAEERIREREYQLFLELRGAVAEQAMLLRQAARAVAELDVLGSFAEKAVRDQWTRPQMVADCGLELEGARHPVVELGLESGFVPNDCKLAPDRRLLILTGPNMSGKSTYLRQTALISIMAQMGSFVPARSSRLGVVDRVFTRVGASDDLHLGQSTFMVEMSETANILHHATPRSLVILDEIGRGTSTFDGLALARAVAEHLHNQTGALTLFATHFHELTALEKELPACRNYRVAVRENRDDIVFLHRIVPGGADRSYGIYVAQLAGFPLVVLERARALLEALERGRGKPAARRSADQMDLFGGNELERAVREAPVEQMSGEEALELLARLKERLGCLSSPPR